MKNKLFEKQVFKNYKELCGYLGWKVTDGKSKVKQINDLKYLCEFKRVGHKYVITKILNSELPIPQPKISNAAIYTQPFEVLINDFLDKNENNLINISKFDLLGKLGLISPQIANIFLKEYVPRDKSIDTNSRIFRTFKDNYINFLNTKLDSALKSMKRRNLIDLKEVLLVRPTNRLNERIATEKEIEFLNLISTQVLKELGCNNRRDISLKNLNSIYNKKIHDKIKSSKFKYIAFYRKGYIIGYAKKVKEYEFKEKYQIEFCKKRINNLTRDALKKIGKSKEESSKTFLTGYAERDAKKNTLNKVKEIIAKDPTLYSESAIEELRESILKDELIISKSAANERFGVFTFHEWTKILDEYVPFEPYDIYNTSDYNFSIKKFLDFLKVEGLHIASK